MADGLLDPDAETQGASREGVEDVHKASVVGRQAPVSVHPLKVRASRVQTCILTHQSTDPTQGTQRSSAKVIRNFTGYPPDFACRVAAGKSCHMGAEAVANQMDVLSRSIGGFLQSIDIK